MSTLTESQVEAMQEGLTHTADNGKLFDEQREDAEDLRATVESSTSAESARAAAKDDFENTRELREQIEARFPGRRASDILDDFFSLDADLRRDPTNKAHEIAKFYARNGRLGEAPKPKTDANPHHEATPAYDLWNAMQKAKKDAGEKERIIAARVKLGEIPLPQVLKNIIDFDDSAAKNPFKAAARLAASYGMPLDAQDVAQQQDAPRQQQIAALEQEVNGKIAAASDRVVRQMFAGRSAEELRAIKLEASQLAASGAVNITGNIEKDVAAIFSAVKQRRAAARRTASDGIDAELRAELRKNLRSARGAA